MNCPKCASADVRVSRHSAWTDSIYSVLGRQAFRCRSCHLRFYRTQTDGGAKPASKRPRSKHRSPKRVRPWMWETVIFAVMLVIFLIFLRYLTREPAAGPEGSQAFFKTHSMQV